MDLQERHLQLDKNATKFIRDSRGLQAHLAREMKVQRSRLSMWLMGVNNIPESYLYKLSSLVETRAEDLLTADSKEFVQRLSYQAAVSAGLSMTATTAKNF